MTESTLPLWYALALAAATLLLTPEPARAADTEAQARYRQEMALCNSGQSPQAPATCRLEARNALAESRRGGLTDTPNGAALNAARRCAAHEGLDRSACEARMRGEGSTSGSVAGGGILRESVTVVPGS